LPQENSPSQSCLLR